MTDRAGQAFGGLGVADGIAIGPAHVVEGGSDRVVEYRVPASDIASEIQRFRDATADALEQLLQLRRQSEHIGGAAGEEMGYLLAAHASMLEGSRLTRGVETDIRARRVNAEAAVEAEISRIARQFSAIADPYLAALNRFGAAREEALIIEDSERGLRAAVAAGIDCVIVHSEFTRTQDFSSAKAVIGSLQELPALLAKLYLQNALAQVN